MSLMYLLCRVLVLIDVTDPRIPNYQISFIENKTSNKAWKFILITQPVSTSYYVIVNIFYILTKIIISSKKMLGILEHNGKFLRKLGGWSKYCK
jgi:3-polyprenyl-4-hydroxybenzoate decarboxylase